MTESRVWSITGCTSGFGRALDELQGEDVLTLSPDVTREEQIERAKHERLRADLAGWEDLARATAFGD